MNTFALSHKVWIEGVAATVASYRKIIDGAVEQLTDEELFISPQPHVNSVATILRHIGGNLISRYTNFFTSDGEKPDRDRDSEFAPWEGTRASLMAYFNSGWDQLVSVIGQIDEKTIDTPIYIRGERLTVASAFLRSLTHTSYHVGQIVLVARAVHQGEWRWLTIAPGASETYNRETWGPGPVGGKS